MELGSVGGLAMSSKAFHEEHSPDSAGQAALFVKFYCDCYACCLHNRT